MKICDHCKKQVPELTKLFPEFEELEVCTPCVSELQDRMIAATIHLGKIRKRQRQKAFAKWKEEA